MVTDPIADFLIRIENAQRSGKESVSVHNSRITRALAELLLQEGYVGEIDASKKKNMLTITLLYKDGRPALRGSKRVSKPSRRMYMGVRDVRPVRQGHGLLVLSTPQGVMTGKDAKAKRVGGEVLFEIW